MIPMNRTASRTAIAIIVFAGVLRFGRLERRHAVGDRLGAGQRHRAAGEGLQEQEDADRPSDAGLDRVGLLRCRPPGR